MKYIDFSVQAIILLLTLGGFGFATGPGNYLVILLSAQLVLGPWQYISSLISVVTNAPFARQKRAHLILSTIYLLMLYFCSLKDFHGVTFPPEIVMPALTIPAWCLGLYYFRITWLWTFSKINHGGKFLPHLSF